jgi:hypothetical protein
MSMHGNSSEQLETVQHNGLTASSIAVSGGRQQPVSQRASLSSA